MATKKAAAANEHKVVLTIPDMGMKQTEINALKRRFKNDIVESLGGQEAMARRRIIIVIVVIVVRSPAPSEW